MLRRALALAVPMCLVLFVPAMAAAQVAWPQVTGDAPELGTWTDASAVEMYDDGTNGDAVAGDGIWTAKVTFTPPGGTTGAWTVQYKIIPPNALLADGTAIGQAPQGASSTPMKLDFPDPNPHTVEFRYSDNTGTGWQPTVSIADSWNTGWSADPTLQSPKTFVVAAAFQNHFGTVAWEPASTVTVLHDDGMGADAKAGDGVATLGLMTSSDVPVGVSGTDADWKIALQGATAGTWSLKLGSDGWNRVDNTGTDATNWSTPFSRWRPERFELDLMRGAAQVVQDDTLYGTPMISELVDTPTGGEYVEIYNPARAIVALDNVYLSDDQAYPTLPAGPTTAAGSSDFTARFPDGAYIPPHAFQTMTTQADTDFTATYPGVNPTYALKTSTVAGTMVPAWTGSVGSGAGLTNSGEFAALFTWATGMPLVEDLDIVVYGTPSAANLAPDKTDTMPSGSAPAYGTDAMTVNTSTAGSHAFGEALARKDFTEDGELLSPCAAPCTVDGSTSGFFNGVWNPVLAGRQDETSENLSTTWYTETLPTPNLPNDATYTITGVVQDSTGNPLAGVTVDAASGANTATATTDATGAFSLTVGFGSWDLTASLIGYDSATVTGVFADHDQALPSPIVLTATTRTWVLSGTVTDSTGAPIVGASVDTSPVTQTATTDATGAYTMTILEGVYDVTASMATYTPKTVTVTLGADTTQDFTLNLVSAGVTVSGTVQDSTAAPLAGASLTLDDGAGTTYSATSAADGTFSFTGVNQSTTYTMTTQLAGYANDSQQVVVATTDVTGLVVTLVPPGVTVSGTVTDSTTTQPIAGVSLVLDDGAGTTYSATSAADGTFSFTQVAAATYTLTATMSGYTDATQQVTVATTDVTGLAVSMNPVAGTWDVSGKITDSATSSPIAGATVSIASLSMQVTSAADGTYTLSGVADGSYTVSVSATGYQPATTDITVSGASLTGVDFQLVAQTTTTYTLSGTVTASDTGNPIAGASVVLTLPDSSTQTQTTDSTGGYAFTSLAAGSYDIAVSATGYQNASVTGISVSADTTQDVALDPAGAQTFTVSGTVQLEARSAGQLAGTTVTVIGVTGATATTAADGTYSIPNIAPGAYEVQAQHDGFVPVKETITVAGDTTANFTLASLSGGGGTTQPGCGCSAAESGGPDPLMGLLFVGLGLMVIGRRRRRR